MATKKAVAQSYFIGEYNKRIGGVDLFDQNHGKYCVKIHSKKKWNCSIVIFQEPELFVPEESTKKIFFNLFDFHILNIFTYSEKGIIKGTGKQLQHIFDPRKDCRMI